MRVLTDSLSTYKERRNKTMANTNRLTPKQKETLAPLEADAKANRKARDRLQKRLALESAIGFEDNKAVKAKIAELDEEYTELSVKISRVYAAESEMMKHMKNALAEIEAVRKIADLWGFAVDI